MAGFTLFFGHNSGVIVSCGWGGGGGGVGISCYIKSLRSERREFFWYVSDVFLVV